MIAEEAGEDEDIKTNFDRRWLHSKATFLGCSYVDLSSGPLR